MPARRAAPFIIHYTSFFNVSFQRILSRRRSGRIFSCPLESLARSNFNDPPARLPAPLPRTCFFCFFHGDTHLGTICQLSPRQIFPHRSAGGARLIQLFYGVSNYTKHRNLRIATRIFTDDTRAGPRAPSPRRISAP